MSLTLNVMGRSRETTSFSVGTSGFANGILLVAVSADVAAVVVVVVAVVVVAAEEEAITKKAFSMGGWVLWF